MDGLEGDDLGQVAVDLLEQLLQVVGVVVAEDVLGHARVLDALDHGRVITRVGEDVAPCNVTTSCYISYNTKA